MACLVSFAWVQSTFKERAERGNYKMKKFLPTVGLIPTKLSSVVRASTDCGLHKTLLLKWHLYKSAIYRSLKVTRIRSERMFRRVLHVESCKHSLLRLFAIRPIWICIMIRTYTNVEEVYLCIKVHLKGCFFFYQTRLAQSVEALTTNLKVVGSSPTVGTNFFSFSTHSLQIDWAHTNEIKHDINPR